MFWVRDRQGSNVQARLKLRDKCGSTVKQRESEQAYPHSCACPLRGHSRDCRHTNTSRVCSRKSRRAGRGFCLHIRLCLKGKSHMLLTHKYLFQSKHHLRHKQFFFKELENVAIGYIWLYYSFQLILPIKLSALWKLLERFDLSFINNVSIPVYLILLITFFTSSTLMSLGPFLLLSALSGFIFSCKALCNLVKKSALKFHIITFVQTFQIFADVVSVACTF